MPVLHVLILVFWKPFDFCHVIFFGGGPQLISSVFEKKGGGGGGGEVLLARIFTNAFVPNK